MNEFNTESLANDDLAVDQLIHAYIDEPEIRGDQQPSLSSHFKVKVQGEEIEVPLDELLQGYSRHQDYTRKTQDISSQRKALEEEQRQSKLQFMEELAKVQALVDHSLPDTDRLELLTDLESKARTYQESLLQEHYQHVEEEKAQHLSKLQEVLPQYWDPQSGSLARTQLRQYLEEQGLNMSEIDQVFDHRFWVLAHKAMERDMIHAKKPLLNQHKKAKEVLPGLAPSASQTHSSPSPGLDQALHDFYQKPNDDQMLRVLRHLV